MLLTELNGVLALERLNAAGAQVRGQAILVSEKHIGNRISDQMEREANY